MPRKTGGPLGGCHGEVGGLTASLLLPVDMEPPSILTAMAVVRGAKSHLFRISEDAKDSSQNGPTNFLAY